MKVIIRDEIKMGSGAEIDVYKFDEEKSAFEQLDDLVEQDVKWLGDPQDADVFDDEAYVFKGDYSIRYYIREVKEV